MYIRLPSLWFVQTGYCVGSKYSHRDLLCDDSLAIASEGIVERCIEAVVIVRASGGEGAVCVRGSGSDDGEGQHGHVVFLRETYLSGRGVQSGFEGSVERGERDLEVNHIVRSRLHGDGLEDGVLGGVLDHRPEYWNSALTIDRTLH